MKRVYRGLLLAIVGIAVLACNRNNTSSGAVAPGETEATVNRFDTNEGAALWWSDHLSPERFAHFKRSVDTSVQKHNIDIHWSHGRISKGTWTGSLDNLLRSCSLEDDAAVCEAIIQEHFQFIDQAIQSQQSTQQLLSRYDSVRARLKIRMHDKKMMLSDEVSVWMEHIPNLASVLVAEFDHGFVHVQKRHLEMWGKTADQVFAQATQNLKSDPQMEPNGFETRGFPIVYLNGELRTSGSQLLFLERYLEHDWEQGYLVSIPASDTLIVSKIGGKKIDSQIDLVYGSTRDAYRDYPNTVSEDIYFWQGGHFELVRITESGNELRIFPGPRLKRILEL
jgi:hypothetical protein